VTILFWFIESIELVLQRKEYLALPLYFLFQDDFEAEEQEHKV
jgi:hypothetical protein